MTKRMTLPSADQTFQHARDILAPGAVIVTTGILLSVGIPWAIITTPVTLPMWLATRRAEPKARAKGKRALAVSLYPMGLAAHVGNWIRRSVTDTTH